MLKEFLERFEDLRRSIFGPDYWLLRAIGEILPESIQGKMVYIILYQLVTFFITSQYIELFVLRSDSDDVLNNIKISMLSVVCTVNENTFVYWQTIWKEVIEYEKENRDDLNSKIDTYTKFCRRAYFYWQSVVITNFVTVISESLIKYLSSASYHRVLQNGTELFTHIFSSWIPFDKNHSPGFWITILWYAGVCTCDSIVIVDYDCCIMLIIVFFGGKLELLREMCKEMPGSRCNDINKEEVGNLMRELNRGLMLLIKNSRLFNAILSPRMFLYVIMCLLMLCATVYQLTLTANTTQKLVIAEYLVFGIAQLFMFCWHSNDVLTKALKGAYSITLHTLFRR